VVELIAKVGEGHTVFGDARVLMQDERLRLRRTVHR